MRTIKTIKDQSVYNVATQLFGDLSELTQVLKQTPDVNQAFPFLTELGFTDTESEVAQLIAQKGYKFATFKRLDIILLDAYVNNNERNKVYLVFNTLVNAANYGMRIKINGVLAQINTVTGNGTSIVEIELENLIEYQDVLMLDYDSTLNGIVSAGSVFRLDDLDNYPVRNLVELSNTEFPYTFNYELS